MVVVVVVVGIDDARIDYCLAIDLSLLLVLKPF
jgi:hypothetical protein